MMKLFFLLLLICPAQAAEKFTFEASQKDCRVVWSLTETTLSVDLSHCALPFIDQFPLHAQALSRLLKKHPVPGGRFTWKGSLGILKKNDWYFPIAIGLASAKSLEWNQKKNQPRDGAWENGLFVRTVNQSHALKEWEELFEKLGYRLHLKSIEKMMEGSAGKLPFWPQLQKQGIKPTQKIFYDSLAGYGFSFEKVSN